MRIGILVLSLLLAFSSICNGDFIDNGNGTVSDTSTGLMWMQMTSSDKLKWQMAFLFCENLTLAGYHDWRLPDIHELKSIVDDKAYNPTIDTRYFPNTESSKYWSSTIVAPGTDFAWNLDFNSGSDSYNYNKSFCYYVRAVRGGE